MQKMTDSECRDFLLKGTRTGKIATVREDGRPDVVPIWFVLDGEDLVFTTWHESVKAMNMRRDPRVCICIDDDRPPFAYVQIEGTAEFSEIPQDLLYWATRIAGRYMGDQAEAYGKRNSARGEVLVRVHPMRMTGVKDVAGW